MPEVATTRSPTNSTKHQAELSFVIPVYNEAESLNELARQISSNIPKGTTSWEVIFVDDGSTDDSWQIIEKLCQEQPQHAPRHGIRLRRNFGKAAALQAGFAATTGKIIFTLDADLQDDPAEIPRFLEAIANGSDVVSGWKQVRHDPWHKVFPSRVFNGMVSKLTGVVLHDHNCGFKCYRREVVQSVRLYGELHRFVPVLAAAQGFRVSELPVQHRPRKFGYSKFGWQRFLKGFLDLLQVRFVTGYGRRPMHGLGTLAVLLSGVSVLCLSLGLLAAYKDYNSLFPLGLFLTATVGFVLAGQAILLGLVSELIISQQLTNTATFNILSETTQPEEPS